MYVIEMDFEDGRVEYGAEFVHELTAQESLAEHMGELKREDGAMVWCMGADWFAALPGELGSTRYRVVPMKGN